MGELVIDFDLHAMPYDLFGVDHVKSSVIYHFQDPPIIWPLITLLTYPI